MNRELTIIIILISSSSCCAFTSANAWKVKLSHYHVDYKRMRTHTNTTESMVYTSIIALLKAENNITSHTHTHTHTHIQ